MNGGSESLPPSLLVNAACGLSAGLDPPTSGCRWHPPQLSRFIRGPRPSATSSAALNSSFAELKYSFSAFVSPGNGCPAPGGPPRGPGSFASRICAAAWNCSTSNPAPATASVVFIDRRSEVRMYTPPALLWGSVGVRIRGNKRISSVGRCAGVEQNTVRPTANGFVLRWQRFAERRELFTRASEA